MVASLAVNSVDFSASYKYGTLHCNNGSTMVVSCAEWFHGNKLDKDVQHAGVL